jgi:hypothetical protein
LVLFRAAYVLIESDTLDLLPEPVSWGPNGHAPYRFLAFEADLRTLLLRFGRMLANLAPEERSIVEHGFM